MIRERDFLIWTRKSRQWNESRFYAIYWIKEDSNG